MQNTSDKEITEEYTGTAEKTDAHGNSANGQEKYKTWIKNDDYQNGYDDPSGDTTLLILYSGDSLLYKKDNDRRGKHQISLSDKK